MWAYTMDLFVSDNIRDQLSMLEFIRRTRQGPGEYILLEFLQCLMKIVTISAETSMLETTDIAWRAPGSTRPNCDVYVLKSTQCGTVV